MGSTLLAHPASNVMNEGAVMKGRSVAVSVAVAGVVGVVALTLAGSTDS